MPGTGPRSASGSTPCSPAARPRRSSILGESGYAEWARINAFCRDIVPMLTLANDMLLPRAPALLADDDFAAVRALIAERLG